MLHMTACTWPSDEHATVESQYIDSRTSLSQLKWKPSATSKVEEKISVRLGRENTCHRVKRQIKH